MRMNIPALWQAIIAFLMTMISGTTLTDIIGQRTAGLAVLLVAALQSATVAYHLAIYRKPPDGKSPLPG